MTDHATFIGKESVGSTDHAMEMTVVKLEKVVWQELLEKMASEEAWKRLQS